MRVGTTPPVARSYSRADVGGEPASEHQLLPTPRDSLRFVQALWRPDEVREVRVLRCDRFGRTASGYFDTPEKLVEAAAAWEGKANVYITVNATDPTSWREPTTASSPRRSPRPQTPRSHDAPGCSSTSTRSGRPGISATEAELAEAEKVLNAVTGYLAGLGWPPPIELPIGQRLLRPLPHRVAQHCRDALDRSEGARDTRVRVQHGRGDNRHHSRQRITYSLPDRDHQEKGRPDGGAASSPLASC